MPLIYRLGLLQALSYATLGAVFPFLALELRERGISGLPLLLAMISAPVLRTLLGPVWGLASDRLGRARPLVLVAGALLLLGLTVAIPPLGTAAAVIGVVLLATGNAGIAPLVDAASLRAVDHDPGRYAGVRRWGSLGFLLAVLSAGGLRDVLELSPLVPGISLAGAFLLAAWGLPRGSPPSRPPLPRGLLRAIRAPSPILLLLASATHFAGIAIYDGFFAVHLDALGHGMIWAGLATALGVGVEIGVFSLAGAWVHRFGAPILLLAALSLNIPRWLMTAWLSDPVLLVSTQVVHGFTFGAFWVAAVVLLSRRVPRTLTGGAQGLLAAAVGGLGAGLGNAIGSLMVDRVETSYMFMVAATLSLLAIGLAVASLLTDHSSGHPPSTPTEGPVEAP